jgi:hypothetical protein
VEAARILHLTVNNTKHTPSQLWLITVKHQIKNSAKNRNLEYCIEDGQLKEICSSKCYYCGVGPSNFIKVRRKDLETVIYQGIDRINSSIGYLPYNVRPCCKDCNRAKSELSDENFKILIVRIYNHMLENRNAD